MGAFMFENSIFEKWLDERATEIVPKLGEGKLEISEMLVLVLKAQTNHFYHLDLDFRKEFSFLRDKSEKFENDFKRINERLEILDKRQELMDRDIQHLRGEFSEFRQETLGRFKDVDTGFKLVQHQFNEVGRRFEQIDRRFEQVDKRFEQVDKRFEQVDKRFEQVDKRLERITQVMMWGGGILAALISGLYLKPII